MALTQVWTEREGDIPGTPMNEGDWEACVATSYSMALLYGGVRMAAPYTQRQRELLEIHGAAADASQDLAASDVMSQRVYGVKLRGATPGLTAAQALGRPGVGMCLTTNNSPGGYGTGFIHEVFWVGVSASAGLLYDPLAPVGSQPQSRTVAYMLPFLRGLGDNQLREVREWEFGPPPPTGGTMAVRPVSEEFTTKTGPSTPGGQFYVDGPGMGTPKHFLTSEKVTSVGETTDGTYRLLFYWNGGPAGGEYLWMPRVNLNPVAGTRKPATGYANSLPIPPCPPAPPTDCAAEVAKAVKPIADELERVKGLIARHNQVETDLHKET